MQLNSIINLKFRRFAIALLLLLVSGCVIQSPIITKQTKSWEKNNYATLNEYTDSLAEWLEYVLTFKDGRYFKNKRFYNDRETRLFDRSSRLMLTSFVTLDDLEKTSSLGRLMAEQIGARLTQQGFTIIDPRLAPDNIQIVPKSGEFMLSRDVLKLSTKHDIQAVVAGHYTVAQTADGVKLFVNIKIIRASDNVVLSSLASGVVINQAIRSLLDDNKDKDVKVSIN
ncbi:MAG: hypothetical protein HQL70_07070 [Magnetococcales bacterium]|nr:hypothetical protein [Magnetococcales bacterium]